MSGTSRLSIFCPIINQNLPAGDDAKVKRSGSRLDIESMSQGVKRTGLTQSAPLWFSGQGDGPHHGCMRIKIRPLDGMSLCSGV